jgi:hypothetical protein
MFCCRGWDRYCVEKKLPRNTLEHVKEVKVHTTYFLMWKLVLKLKFISARSPIFFFVYLLQCHQQPVGSKLCGFYCAYHMLKLKERGSDTEVLSWDFHL